ncbi:hypothetical protein ACFWRR_17490 [Streptomyces cellulosae]
MGRYLCWMAPRPDDGLREDRRVLIAAAYRTSWRRVSQAGGAPATYRSYADRVAHDLKEYTPARPEVTLAGVGQDGGGPGPGRDRGHRRSAPGISGRSAASR